MHIEATLRQVSHEPLDLVQVGRAPLRRDGEDQRTVLGQPAKCLIPALLVDAVRAVQPVGVNQAAGHLVVLADARSALVDHDVQSAHAERIGVADVRSSRDAVGCDAGEDLASNLLVAFGIEEPTARTLELVEGVDDEALEQPGVAT